MSVNVCKSSSLLLLLPSSLSLSLSLLSSHILHISLVDSYASQDEHTHRHTHTQSHANCTETGWGGKKSSFLLALLTQWEMSYGKRHCLPAGRIHCKHCVHLHFSWPFVNCVSPLSNRSFRLLSCHTCRHSLHHHQKLFFIFTDSSLSLSLPFSSCTHVFPAFIRVFISFSLRSVHSSHFATLIAFVCVSLDGFAVTTLFLSLALLLLLLLLHSLAFLYQCFHASKELNFTTKWQCTSDSTVARRIFLSFMCLRFFFHSIPSLREEEEGESLNWCHAERKMGQGEEVDEKKTRARAIMYRMQWKSIKYEFRVHKWIMKILRFLCFSLLIWGDLHPARWVSELEMHRLREADGEGEEDIASWIRLAPGPV